MPVTVPLTGEELAGLLALRWNGATWPAIAFVLGKREDGLQRAGSKFIKRMGWGNIMGEHSSKKPRGFAAMSPEKRSAIAAKGGRSVPAAKRAFSTNRELARACGSKGGISVDPAKRMFARDPAKAAEAGRTGGLRTGAARKRRGAETVVPTA